MRKLLTGCGIVILIVFATLVGTCFFGGSLWQKRISHFQDKVAAEEALEKSWRPPAPELGREWFPAKVTGWSLSGSNAAPGFPTLDLDRGGWQGTYTSGKENIQVSVAPANATERDALMSRVEAALTKPTTTVKQFGNGTSTSGSFTFSSDNSHWMTRFGSRMSVTHNGQKSQVRALNDWLFIFQGIEGADPEDFVKEYLKAIDAGSGSAF